MPKPDDDLVQRVLQMVQTAEDVDYFFDNLTSPEWIEPLAKAHLFDSPPAPIAVDGGVQLPAWSASRYLGRMAPLAPLKVRDVLRTIPDTDNVRVTQNLVDALVAMPPEMAAEFVPRVVSWLKGPYQLLLPTKVSDLLRRFADEAMVEEAITLAESLFKLRRGESISVGEDGFTHEWPSEALPIIDQYEYERALARIRPDLIAGTGMVGLEFLRDLLVSAMELEERSSQSEKQDLSWIWRPAIEPHAQNDPGMGIRNVIISVLRDAAIQVARADRSLLRLVVGSLESTGWPVLRRIAVDVIREVAPRRSALVSARIVSESSMYDVDIHHEYWMLLNERFGQLTPTQQQSVIGLIRRGPPLYRLTDAEVDDSEVGREAWQARMLSAIERELPTDVHDWFDELVSKGRLNEHPEFLSYTTGMWVGPTSPVGDAEFGEMTDDELIEFLNSWEPEPGWRKPSREGLGRTLSEAVRQSPERYAEHAESFRALDPTYVNAILDAFRTAGGNGVVFSWEPVLNLAGWVVAQGSKVPNLEKDVGSSESDWTGPRGTIAHLLDVGLKEGPSEILFELRELVWSVLEPLLEDRDPTVEDEARFGGSNMDPQSYAINTVRGQAMETAVKYGLWVHRHDSELKSGQLPGFDRMPELRAVLDRHLVVRHDRSVAVRSMYGRWLPWLLLMDSNWTQVNIKRIFPSRQASAQYWEAAWEAYIAFCPAFNSVFEATRSEYLRAIGRLSGSSPDRRHPMMYQQHFAQHLMLFYLRGELELRDKLLVEFFKVAPADVRASALRFVGRAFYRIEAGEIVPLDDPPSQVIIERACALWESRFLAAELIGLDDSGARELAEFGWWFPAPVFEPTWLLSNLGAAVRLGTTVEARHLVARRLAELAPSEPAAVLEAFDLMLRGDSESWMVLSAPDEVQLMLHAALTNSDPTVRAYAEEITNTLGARGFRQFRTLLTDVEH